MTISIGGTFLIPVRLGGVATEAKSNLHEYHKDDMGNGGRKKICKKCNADLTEADIIKGIEISKGQVVTFTKEELDSLPLSTTKNIEIDRFVQAGDVNPLLTDKTYHISPDEVGVTAFNLLFEGLKKTGKVAVGKVAISRRENLCVIRPTGKSLVLSTLYWSGEMKESPAVPASEVSDVQVDLITQVIGKFSKPFRHDDYSDNYMDALNKMAEDKLAGKDIVITSQPEVPQQNIEDALKALAESE